MCARLAVRFILAFFVCGEFSVWERVDDVVPEPIEIRFRLCSEARRISIGSAAGSVGASRPARYRVASYTRMAPSCSSSGAANSRSPLAIRSRNTGLRVTTWFVAGEYFWTGASCTITLLRRSRSARPPSSNCGPAGAGSPAVPPHTIFRKVQIVAVLVVDEVALVQLPDELFASGGPLASVTTLVRAVTAAQPRRVRKLGFP